MQSKKTKCKTKMNRKVKKNNGLQNYDESTQEVTPIFGCGF